jgi:mannose-1-phosphate guanylyltransferase
VQALPQQVYAVILAGGSGTRFWPKSRHLLPKQLCKIGDSDQTMLELTLSRLDGLVPPERRLIVTHHEQMEKTKELAGQACQHYLAEPAAKNTANALAFAALEIQRLAPKDAQPIMVSLHADALIKNLDAFRQTLHGMVRSAREGYLALLGITPEYPETGYGYIERGAELTSLRGTFQVSSFREKPDRHLALQYLETGRFLWNSGIFAWRIDVILEELQRFLPASMQALRALGAEQPATSLTSLPWNQVDQTYRNLPSIAIDPAVLERSQRVAVLEADIGWKDVGSWDALDQCFSPDAQQNLFFGPVTALECQGLTVDSDAQMVACIGLKDMVVVASQGAILVCPKDRAQEVRKIVEALKSQGQQALT